uniref:Uncharacterized protein n=1 Tax=Arundo donax TaxID=35708 RepID=A0A0A9FRR8_ARUDO
MKIEKIYLRTICFLILICVKKSEIFQF